MRGSAFHRLLSLGSILLLGGLSLLVGAQGAEEKRLLAALRDASYKVRLQAAILIGKKNLLGAAAGLQQALDDENDAVRAAAALSLGKLAQQPARAKIAALLGHENTLVSRSAEKSLGLLDQALGRPVYLVVVEPPALGNGVPPALGKRLEGLLAVKFSAVRGLVPGAGEEKILKGQALAAHLLRRGLAGVLLRPRLSGMREKFDGTQTVIEGKVEILVVILERLRLEFSASGEANAWIEGGDLSDDDRTELQDTVMESAAQAAVNQVTQHLSSR